MPRLTEITVAVLLAAACADGPTHPHANETWVLTTVDGQSLPAQVQFGFATYTIVADTIQFLDGNDWRRSRAFVESVPNNPSVQRLMTSTGFVTLRGGGIVLDFECDDTENCAPRPVLTRDGNTLVLNEQFQPPSEDLVYQRVR